jgi:hypothetical protein
MSNDTKKPDPIFAHHSVVRERPSQESSATTGCLRCEMSHPQTRRCWEHRFDGPLCLLADCTAERWIDPQARYSSSCYCAEHRKGREIAAIDPRFIKDHPNPAPPEAKQCDDGKEEIKRPCEVHHCGAESMGLVLRKWTCEAHWGHQNRLYDNAMELLDLGVPLHRYLTPEERAQDLVRWRQDIEEHNREKEATR